MDQTTQLTGFVAMAVLVCVPATWLFSQGLLRLYRRSVLRHMRAQANRAAVDDAANEIVRSARPAAVALDSIETRMRAGAWALARKYAAAGACGAAATVVTLCWLANIELLPLRVLIVFMASATPIVLTTTSIAAVTRADAVRVWLVYLGVYSVCGIAMALVNTNSHWYDAWLIWLTRNAPPLVCVWLVMQRTIRTIGTLMLGITGISFVGASLPTFLADPQLRAITRVPLSLGFGAYGTIALIVVLGLLAFGALALAGLKAVGALYERKRISEHSLTLDGIWLAFSLSHAVSSTFSAGLRGFVIGFTPFIAYRIALALLLRRGRATNAAPRLLFLRVFELGKRSEQLWDLLAKTYRYAGSVRMIAGPDLAARSIEPHELLEFLTGRLGARFIAGTQMLQRSLARLDDAPDLDGRFRVNDLFCRDDTWQAAFAGLLADSDAVLMDLRSFTRERSGSSFELETLVRSAPLERVLLLVDESTDTAFLDQLLSRASEQRRLPDAQPRILHADLTSRRGANEFRHALAAAFFEDARHAAPVGGPANDAIGTA